MNTGVDAAFWHRGYLLTILASAEETDGRFSLVEGLARRGVSEEPPLHIHTCEAEYVYLLEGELTFQVGDELTRATAPTFIALPRDVPHRFEVASERARFLHLYVPGGYDGFYRELSEPARSRVPPPLGPRDAGRLIIVAAKYGVEIMSPAPR